MFIPKKYELNNGIVQWCLADGKHHREDGPAVVYPDGEQHWYLYGWYHRTGGLAIIRADQTEEYWLDGIQYDPITFLIKSYEYTNEI